MNQVNATHAAIALAVLAIAGFFIPALGIPAVLFALYLAEAQPERLAP